PELCLCSYTLGDIIINDDLLDTVSMYIAKLCEYTKDNDALLIYGAPLKNGNKLFNCAIVSCKGKILGVVPKSNIPDYNEYYEKRYFEKAPVDNGKIRINGTLYPFGVHLLFRNSRYINEIVAIEICEDFWMNIAPSTYHSEAGARIICNLSASNETIHKDDYRKALITTTANKEKVAYLYCSSSASESTADVIMSGAMAVADPSGIFAENDLFTEDCLCTTIDLDYIDSERIRTTSSNYAFDHSKYQTIFFESDVSFSHVNRKFNKFPFIDEDKEKSRRSVLKANYMQGRAIARRLEQIGLKDVVIGISGGLDSTVALLGCVAAMDYLKLDYTHIHAITMPCFGTTSRTKSNAVLLCENLGIPVKEIDIKNAVSVHLNDIGHEIANDVTFENAQARERTQILMDYCNQVKGIVIGTGDLSEIALGWSTYNGDHMSMYAVNNTFTKTFIKEMSYWLAHEEKYAAVKDIILDVLNTPISPELIEAQNEEISQKTEDIIGPYELHDFFLYHFIYQHYNLKKVYIIACDTFKDTYSPEVVKKWLALFIRRFFNNQFKRSCIPDGAKISEVSLSPRGDFRMPSDTSYETFLDIVNNL
ncbi:MAG: NAD(+) synthase, partial [Bacilli bacterium]|nr:NAD(+) synthase [Bacilli bacterium]